MNRKEYRKKLKQEEKEAEKMEKRGDVEEGEENYKEAIKDALQNKWVQALMGLTGLAVVSLIALLMIRGNHQEPVRQVDFTSLFPEVDYTLEIDEREDEVVGWVVSEELEAVDAVSLSNAIRKEKEKDVRLLVFEAEHTGRTLPEFHVEGMRYDVQTYPDNRYETRTYYPMPSIDADVESVRNWDINTNESYVDSNNILHVSGSVPTMATTEETVAFLKGLNGVIADMNDKSFTNTFFHIKSGLSDMVFSANHPNVIADVELYQMGEISKGDES